jgi:glycosyltransferase involved in cell wall biosynthesis
MQPACAAFGVRCPWPVRPLETMRIAQIAPLFESVPPRLYGGTERVVSWLTEELARRGHDVTLFASGDSRTAARLFAVVPRGLRLDRQMPDPIAAHVAALGCAAERLDEFDVVHSHVDLHGLLLGHFATTPFLHTLHGRLDMPGLRDVYRCFTRAPLVSISDSQRQPLAALGLNWRATVHHGLPLDHVPMPARGGQGGYLAFLGRISPEKGVTIAIEVAHAVGIPLRIAAKVDPADRVYFEQHVRPLIDGTFVEYLGEIGDEEKWKFLGEALCLLFPVDWPEPFGIAAIEALACGTPVVARPCGALPEIVVDGTTGWLADGVPALAAAVRRVEKLDRVRCRAVVQRRFSVRAMADAYEAVYRGLMDEMSRAA